MKIRRGSPSLKLILGGLSASALLVPVVVALAIGAIVGQSRPHALVFRLEYLSRELGEALLVEKDKGLVLKPGYRAPAGLELVVEDVDDRVLFSTLPDFPAGSTAGLDEIAASLREGAAKLSFSAETIRSKGVVLGRYFAWSSSDELPAPVHPYPTFFLVMVGLLVLAFAAGFLVAAKLARAVMRLERAALRIATGDLESGVSVGGIREIEDLSRTMDGMRLALREDRDRRSRFLAAVSHDLRTPLTSIGGYLEAVEDGLAADPATLARYVGIMRGKTRILEERIASLLEVAKMRTSEWRSGFVEIELRSFLEARCREFREDAALMDRDFRWELSALGGLRVAADEVLLARAVENLVSNAIRYSPAGGELRMTARREGPEAGAAYIVDIDDDGPGIGPDERELVFEAFVRGRSAKAGEGQGLGLYIARTMVRGHGWELVASASPSGGGRISIVIPAGQ